MADKSSVKVDINDPMPTREEYAAMSKKEKQALQAKNAKYFKSTVTSLSEKAEAVVNTTLPQKIKQLDAMYKGFSKIDTLLSEVVSKVILPVDTYENVMNGDEAKSAGKSPKKNPPAKRRKLNNSSSSKASEKKMYNPATEKIWAKKNVTPEELERCLSEVPTNSSIKGVLVPLKRETLELIEIIGILKIWIQLNIPRIEDGNNFGVGVQEEILGEVSRVEDAAFAIIDQMTKYFVTRGKLVSKVLKHSGIQDYREGVKELDEKEYIQLRLSCLDMRNHYYLLYDMITKNLDKIRQPRSNNTPNMF